MCLAVPARILSIDGDSAMVEMGEIKQDCYLHIIDDVKVGDYVIVHAGYAIEILDPVEAEETLKLFRQWREMEND